VVDRAPVALEPPSAGSARPWACALLALAALAAPARASADAMPLGGAITGHAALADGDAGAGLVLDVWAAIDWLRVGGFFGVAATPSDRDDHNRVLMPIGALIAIDAAPASEIALLLRVRAGGWGGATQAEKLTGGFFVGGGVHFGYRLGHGVVLSMGVDLWAVIASDAWRSATGPDDARSASVLAIAPGIGLSWTPEENE
jgi:hypothetical protein